MRLPARRLFTLRVTGLAAALVLSACASGPGADPQATLARADAAMGSAAVRTLQFSAKGTGATFGQAWQPGLAWPKLNYSNLSRAMDYQAGAFREDFARSRGEPNGGGATPLMGTGEQRATGLAMNGHAWNMVGPAPQPAPVALDMRVHDLWTSPHGVLKAARQFNASAASVSDGGRAYTALSFTSPGRFSATAWINADGLVERVVSRQPNPVMGDIEVVTDYSGYRDVGGGAKFPARIRQTQGGFEVLDVAVDDVKLNTPMDVSVPPLVSGFSERVASEKVADGVWFLGGGSHNSVLIEMSDHLVVVEAPLYDGRAAAVLAEAKKLVPGKPVRTVVNSHHHFDHAGGLRTAVADGATLVTSAMAKPWFEKTFANPNRIAPDALARSGRSATVVGVNGVHRMSDGSRTVEVHEMTGSVHAQGFLMVVLPRERLLIEADAYTPGAPNTPPPAQPNGNNVNLVENIERLKLGVDRILPLHGRVVPLSELYAMVGRKAP